MKRHYDQLAADPADAQFTVIATPVVHAPLQLPRGTGVSPPTRAALNAFLANAEQMMEITDALLTSLNRAQGAINARNAYWTQQQMQAAVQYAQRDATIISAEPMLLARLQHTLQAAGVHITVTLADIRKFQQHVVTQGLPPSMTQTFKQLGVDSATIGQIQGQFAVPDPLASPGRFPDMLTDPQLIAAINASADALRKFAAAASKRPSVPAAVANTIPARGVLRAGTTHLKAATKASAESLRQFAASAAAASCNAPKPPGTAVPTAQATAQQPTKLTLTVHGRTAWDSVTDGAVSHKDPALPVTLTVGTALTAQAVTDAPMPKGWLLHLYRTGERDPKTGGYLEICRSTTTTCSATRPGLTMTAEEAVSAQVTAPTYSALSAQLLVDWTKP